MCATSSASSVREFECLPGPTPQYSVPPSPASNVRARPSADALNFLLRMGNHEYVCALHDRYGDTVRLRQDGQNVLFVRGPETVARALGQTEGNDFGKSFAQADALSSEYLQYFKNLVQPLLKGADIFGSGETSHRRTALKRCFKSSDEFLPTLNA